MASVRLDAGSLSARGAVIFAGGFLGTAARVWTQRLVGHEPTGLAVVNLLGCLALGLISGHFGQRVTLLRLFLAVGGVAAFTSWSSLALQGIGSPGAAAVAIAQTVAGVALAGVGHIFGLRGLRSAGARR